MVSTAAGSPAPPGRGEITASLSGAPSAWRNTRAARFPGSTVALLKWSLRENNTGYTRAMSDLAERSLGARLWAWGQERFPPAHASLFFVLFAAALLYGRSLVVP